jgi:hypothetical protein
MAGMPIWEVTLFVDGPVSVRDRVRTTRPEGFRNPFESEIKIQSVPSGLRATVTVRAPDQPLAYQAAVVFFGRMLDALTLTVNLPMFLSLTERKRTGAESHDTRRLIEPDEIEKAFDEADNLARREEGRPFLKSLGWYRKGLTADDPLDSFLAYWNAIERVSSDYYKADPDTDKKRATKGSKSRVWECFKALWGECEKWPVVPRRMDWIDKSCDTRNEIAHGQAPIDIRYVAEVAGRLPEINKVCYGFLTGWRERLDSYPPRKPSLGTGSPSPA